MYSDEYIIIIRRKNMKKLRSFLCVALCFAMIFVLFGCDGGENIATTPGNITTTTPDATTPGGDIAPNEGIVAYYDDYIPVIGGISADGEDIKVDGEVIELKKANGVMNFHAVGVGRATISDGERSVEVIIEKAKLNIIVIMGQSNSGNHFDNARSDIGCAKGTAYWWGNGQGTRATKPVDFIDKTLGFHSTLLAELYAQSVKNGSPEKNVLIWHEGGLNGGGTSKNGSSITGWAASPTDTSGTDYTVQMVNSCVEYYEANSDKFEIVSKGVYWLQGEGDGVREMDAGLYSDCFMAMWSKLKSEAGLEYMAIMRVRRGGDKNVKNDDIYYSTTSAAQYALANRYDDIYMATTITENFTGGPTEERSISIKNYITLTERYRDSGEINDVYGNKATYKNGILTTTMSTLFGSNNNNHYGKFGYMIIGADAAYNMYRALHSGIISITQATSNGRPSEQKVTAGGKLAAIDITDMTGDLSFYATPGSVAGVVSIKVTSNGKDITAEEGLINTSGSSYGCISIKQLKTHSDIEIAIEYAVKGGEVSTVRYDVKNDSVVLDEPASSYVWDFDEDLFARDENGKKVNAFVSAPIYGSYALEGGMLKASKLQLELVRVIDLKADKNWSIEIRFGDMSGASGFILASKASNVVGNKAFSYRGGKLNLSSYASGALGTGYYNYAPAGATITSGSVLKVVNTYDEATRSGRMSVYKDGVLVIDNIQQSTGDYNGSGAGQDMSAYAVDSAISLAYLGCSNSSGSFLLTMQIDQIRVDLG